MSDMPPDMNPLPAPPKPHLWRAVSWGFTLLVLIGVLAPVASGIALFTRGPLSADKTIVVPRGASAAEIADMLSREDAVYLPALFRGAARLIGSLKAGEYAVPAHSSPLEIAVLMHEGRSVARLFTVAEGLTSAEIVELLKNEAVLSGSIDRLPEEGTLLPETYRYSYGDTRAGVIARMQKAMQEKMNEVWARREPGLPIKSINEAVVMASLVEKETGKAAERARVAGVFYNRLRQKMRLQSDPTVIYALTKGKKPLERGLTHEDLAFPSPINTYASDGLPPQPICNPGEAALEAAIHPEHNAFLYFVADGNGGHLFASDLIGHNRNVIQWRQATGTSLIKP